MSDRPLHYLYYIVGDRPVRVGESEAGVPVRADVFNNDTKEFEIDNLFLDIIAKSLDVQQIDEDSYRQWCLKNGVQAL